ncbi:repressor of the inhibitor of the protein kinase [Merluccius polli]|uniref:Repressor of the inhibitor of the protein kinase n=1 Tax=Merluccius polli TaxID=89951 RepID=A0AA47MW11_MERPO|nr:repressor of the inhibitor of the protein kinase [Merluccius polli]
MDCKCQVDVGATVSDHFVGFLPVLDTSGAGLTDVFLKHMEKLGLAISKCRGQAYDNGSNMRGKNNGVQKRVLDINKKSTVHAMHQPHSLNLVIVVAAKSTVDSVSFGVLQRLYTIFSSSTQRWELFKENVPQMTLKPISNTRWECCVESVKVLRYKLPDVGNALPSLKKVIVTPRLQTLEQEIMSSKFLLTVIIWYNALHEVNRVSKLLQSPQVGIDVLQHEVEYVLKFLKKYRENDLLSAQTDARDIAEEMGMPMVFPTAQIRKPKRQFQYESQICLASFMEERKKAIQSRTLKDSCVNMEKTLGDVDAGDLLREVSAAVNAVPAKETTGLQILSYIYSNNLVELYPNLSIALRLMVTVPVTVATGERSFSHLKLIKTHLRSTMLQERLSALAWISIEHEVTRSLDKDELIRAFSAHKHRRVKF